MTRGKANYALAAIGGDNFAQIFRSRLMRPPARPLSPRSASRSARSASAGRGLEPAPAKAGGEGQMQTATWPRPTSANTMRPSPQQAPTWPPTRCGHAPTSASVAAPVRSRCAAPASESRRPPRGFPVQHRADIVRPGANIDDGHHAATGPHDCHGRRANSAGTHTRHGRARLALGLGPEGPGHDVGEAGDATRPAGVTPCRRARSAQAAPCKRRLVGP
jgi:hypothetical protein